MSFQGSLQTLAAAFATFYVSCLCIGRPDIPRKVIAELRVQAFAGTKSGWGCPSDFNKKACKEYDPKRYRR